MARANLARRKKQGVILLVIGVVIMVSFFLVDTLSYLSCKSAKEIWCGLEFALLSIPILGASAILTIMGIVKTVSAKKATKKAKRGEIVAKKSDSWGGFIRSILFAIAIPAAVFR